MKTDAWFPNEISETSSFLSSRNLGTVQHIVFCSSLGKNHGCESAPQSHIPAQNEALQRMQCYAMIEGHGGTSCADFIKNSLLKTIVEKWRLFGDLTNIPNALCQVADMSLISLEDSFLKVAKQQADNSGASVVVTLYLDGWLCVSNVGDLTAVLFDNIGKDRLISRTHTASNKKECMRIFAAGGNISKVGTFQIHQSLKRSRTIGSLELKMKYPGILISSPETSFVKLETDQKVYIPSLILAPSSLWCVGGKLQLFIRKVTQSWNKYSATNSTNNQNPCSAIINYAKMVGYRDQLRLLCVQIT